MDIKCVSLDLDGTLLNSNREISFINKDTIRQLQEKGIEVILNTGRAYFDVINVPGVREMNCPIFCVNGSALYSRTGELLYEATISFSKYKEIFSILNNLGVGILVYTNHGGFPTTIPKLHDKSKKELESLFNEFSYDQIQKLSNLKIYKLVAYVHYDDSENIGPVKQALAGIDQIATASSFINNVEITSKEAQKGNALRTYQAIMNQSFAEIYAFGDGGNDLSQFEAATCSVAMANAPEEIKRKADIVTKSNDENGVAYAIKDILKLV